MPVLQLTPKFISSLQCQPGRSRTEWCDSTVKGLYAEARHTSPGVGTYYLRYKAAGGKTRHLRLGSTTALSLAEARKLAAEKKAEIHHGADPAGVRKKQKAIPLFRDFIVQQYQPYTKVRKRSYHTDELRFNQRILPEFGDIRMDAITSKQLVAFHTALKEEHGLAASTCDHFIKLIRHAFNMAIQWDVVQANPAVKVALYNEDNRIENIMDDDQLRQLLVVLDTHTNRSACQIALFLLGTGCRLNEALTARWEQIDLSNKVWRIPSANSKSKKMRPVPLNGYAMEVLETIREQGAHDEWVFFNHKTGDRFKTLHTAWGTIRNAAGMPWLRIHDLRHTYASLLVNSGRSLYEVQNLLGHSTPVVTQRYAHMNTETLLAASEVASERLRAASPRLLPHSPSQ